MTNTINNYVEELIKARITSRIKHIELAKIMDILGVTSLYICGNSLNTEIPNDYDIYLLEDDSFRLHDLSSNELFKVKIEKIGYKITSSTKNAITLKNNSVILQICLYHKPTLKELVDSFDFTYCQVGVEVSFDWLNVLNISDEYFTFGYLEFLTSRVTHYTGSEYPISSLLRLFKVKDKGYLPGNLHIRELITILIEIVERGFDDYDDFKDQLDAIDLGLLSEDLNSIDKNNLLKLFILMGKDKESVEASKEFLK